VGQGHEVTVRLPAGALTALGMEGIRAAFFAQYEAIYGYAHRHLGLEVMTLRLTASGGSPELRLAATAGIAAGGAVKGRRPVFVAAWERFAAVPVYDRYALASGVELAGPCIIEEPDSTAVIGPEVTVRVDAYCNLIATFDDRS
jgi:N-methylhydantoinase A/oxoprolinase/acetone carboxylase beta subunit